MASAFVPGSSGLGPSPGRGNCTRNFNLIVPHSTQMNKWLPANVILEVTYYVQASYPERI